MAKRKDNIVPFEKKPIIQLPEQYPRAITARITSVIQRREQYSRDVVEYSASYETAAYLKDKLETLTEGKRTPLDKVPHFRNVLNQARTELPAHLELIESHNRHIVELPKLEISSKSGLLPFKIKEDD